MEYGENDDKRYYFFEVLKEYKEFAIISKIDPIEYKERSSPVSPPGEKGLHVSLTTIKASQTETVYFLTSAGEIEPYLKLVHKVVERELYDRKKTNSKVLDDRLMAKFFSKADLSGMVKFATDNNLEFDIKEDLIKIFNAIN
jgi:hypothetical protein